LGTVTKLVLLTLVGLFAVKAFSRGRGRWRELGRRFHRAINVAAVLLVVVYGAYALWLVSQP
jgi:hypothetical protein